MKNPIIELASVAWQRKEGKSTSGGLNSKGVASYRRENPGSKLKTAVTTEPSKLKPGSKPAKRRKSFCARMSGMNGPMEKPNGEPTRKALSLRKWNCSSKEPLIQFARGDFFKKAGLWKPGDNAFGMTYERVMQVAKDRSASPDFRNELAQELRRHLRSPDRLEVFRINANSKRSSETFRKSREAFEKESAQDQARWRREKRNALIGVSAGVGVAGAGAYLATRKREPVEFGISGTADSVPRADIRPKLIPLRKKKIVQFDDSPLQPHQRRVIRRITDPNTRGLVVVHGLGSGKTRTAIEAHKALGGSADVIVPAALQGNYAKEVEKWGGDPAQTRIQSQQRVATSKEPLTGDNLIVDEGHRARNAKTKISDALKGHPAKKRLILSGTPIYNSPSDIATLVNQAAGKSVLREGKAFDNRYLRPNLIRRWQGDRLSHSGELKKALNKYVDYHKGDPSMLPKVTSRTIPVEMTKHQSDLYRASIGRIPKGMKLDTKHIERLKPYLTGARQVSNSATALDPSSTDAPKIDRAFTDLQHHLKNPKGKALVYSNWLEHGINPLHERLKAAKVPHGVFTGDESMKLRNQTVRDYNEGKHRALLVSSSGAEGLDLKGTRMVQVLEPHFNNAKIRQVVGRSARMGSHSALGPEDRNVEVRQYVARPKNRFLPGYGKGVEDLLNESARDKDEVARQITRLLHSKAKLIRFGIKKASPEAAARIASILNKKAGMEWWNSGMPKKAIPLRAIEKDGVPHLLTYRRTASGGRDSMTKPVEGWTNTNGPILSTSTNRESTKRYPMMYGRPGKEPAIGTYAIPESELGKASAHLGEQEVRHPDMAKFLVRVRSGSTRLSSKTKTIRFDRPKEDRIKKVQKRSSNLFRGSAWEKDAELRGIRKAVQSKADPKFVKYDKKGKRGLISRVTESGDRQHIQDQSVSGALPVRRGGQPGAHKNPDGSYKYPTQDFPKGEDYQQASKVTKRTHLEPFKTGTGHYADDWRDTEAFQKATAPIVKRRIEEMKAKGAKPPGSIKQQASAAKRGIEPNDISKEFLKETSKLTRTPEQIREAMTAPRQELAKELGTRKTIAQEYNRRYVGGKAKPLTQWSGKAASLPPAEKINQAMDNLPKLIPAREAKFKSAGDMLHGKLFNRVRTHVAATEGAKQGWGEKEINSRAHQIMEPLNSPPPPKGLVGALGASEIPSKARQATAEGREALATALGRDTEQVDRLRENIYRLRNTGGEKAQRTIKRSLIRSGKVFESIPDAPEKIPSFRTDLTKYPRLKKYGIAAGVVGAGLLAKKLLTKREEPPQQKQLLSSRAKLIRFGLKPSLYAEHLLWKKAVTKPQLALPWSGAAVSHPGIDRNARIALRRQAERAEAKRSLNLPRSSDWEARKVASEKARMESTPNLPSILDREAEKKAAPHIAKAEKKIEAIKASEKALRDKQLNEYTIAKTHALGEQKAKHANEIKGIQSGVRKKIAIGVGVGAAAGAAGGYAARRPEKEMEFSSRFASLIPTRKPATIISKMADKFRSLSTGGKVGLIAGSFTPIPGGSFAGAAAGHGIEQAGRKIVKKITDKPTKPLGQLIMQKHGPKRIVPVFQASSKLTPIRFDVNALQKIRNRIETKHEPSTFHDIAVGGIEGGAGVLATDRLIHKFAPAGSPLWRKIAIGTGVGAAATGLIGAGVSAANRKRQEQRPLSELSSKRRIIQLDTAPGLPPSRAVTRDRYVKHIHEADMDSAEAGYLRTGAGGAAIGSMLAKKGLRGKAALIGAGAGVLTQGITRHYTGQTKDQFGDRTYAAKRADRVPGQVAGVAALGLAGKIGHDKLKSAKVVASKWGRRAAGAGIAGLGAYAASKLFSSKAPVIRFDQQEKHWTDKWIGPKANYKRRSEDLQQAGRRVSGALRDVGGVLRGEKPVDARGRPRKQEWDKPYVKKWIATGIGIAGLGAAAKISRGRAGFKPGSGLANLKQDIDSGVVKDVLKAKLKAKFPKTYEAASSARSKIKGEVQGTKDELASAMGGTDKSLAGRVSNYFRTEHKAVAKVAPVETAGVHAVFPGAELTEAQKKAIEQANARGAALSHTAANVTTGKQADKLSKVSGDNDALDKVAAKLKREDDLKKQAEKTKNMFSSNTKPIRFGEDTVYDDQWEHWVRNRPGVVKRNREPKPWHKRSENQPLIQAGIFAGTAMGTALLTRKFAPKAKDAAKAAGFSSRDPIIALSARLDTYLSQ